MKIYTKKGDKGETGLLNGTRIPKNHAQIECVGQLDELNCCFGLIGAQQQPYNNQLAINYQPIQEALFVIGSHVAVDQSKKLNFELPKWDQSMIDSLENQIDKMDEELPELKYFILPGGNALTAQIHYTRAVSRRAERAMVTVSQLFEVNPDFIIYLNRISDYLFVLARYVSHKLQIEEIKWNS